MNWNPSLTKQLIQHFNHIFVGAGNLFSTVEELYLWYQALHGDEAWRPYDCGSHFGRGYGYQAAFIPIYGLDIVVIMLSNFWDAPLDQMVMDVQEILLEDDLIELDTAVLDSYAGEYHADLIELDTAVLDSYAGEYHALFPDGRVTTILISRVGNHLFVNDIGSNILGFFSLYPLTPERFIIKIPQGGLFDFQIDDSDNISQIIIGDDVIELTLIE